MAMKYREPNRARWVGVRPGHDGTQVLEFGEADNSMVIIYTVPPAKTFHFTGYDYAHTNFGAANWASLIIYDATPAAWRGIFTFFVPAAGQLAVTRSYWPPLELPAGYSINLLSLGVGVHPSALISGWVENA